MGLWTGVEWTAWYHMKQRCLDPSDPRYKDYGGRGITICERWLNSMEEFFKDLGYKPNSSFVLDRIDNDGNYEPGNVRWVSRRESALNRRKQSNASKYGTGIYMTSIGIYYAVIKINGKIIHLGNFRNLEDAKEARLKAELTMKKIVAVK